MIYRYEIEKKPIERTYLSIDLMLVKSYDWPPQDKRDKFIFSQSIFIEVPLRGSFVIWDILFLNKNKNQTVSTIHEMVFFIQENGKNYGKYIQNVYKLIKVDDFN